MLLPLLRDLGIFTIGAGILGWVLRYLIKQYFEQQSKEYQNKLDRQLQEHQNQLDRQLQEHQNELDKQLQEYQNELEKERIVFSDLHNNRGEAMSELYAKIVELEEDMRSLVRPFQRTGDIPEEEKIDQAADSGEELRKYYNKNKIYFSPDICQTVDDMLDVFKEIHDDFAIREIHKTDPDGSVDKFEERVEDWETLDDGDIPELKTQLEEQFRDLLGVQTTQ